MKNRILAFIAVMLLISCLFTVYAEGTESVYRASDVINDCGISTSGNGSKLTATAQIRGTEPCDKIGFKYIFIQELRDGKWVTIASDYDVYSYNTSTKRASLSCTKESGKQYRAVATGYALLDGVSDTAWCSSEH